MRQPTAQEIGQLSYQIQTAKITKNLSYYRSVVAPKITKNISRYDYIASTVGCPLVLVPLIHLREKASDLGLFKAYLGNGQPWNKKTTIVPRGRGPFISWEQAALDAMRLDGIDKVLGWNLEKMLFILEGFNGYGYRRRGVPSPYVWAGTNQYKRGKYIRDGVYSPTAVDGQLGVFAMYALLSQLNSAFTVPTASTITVPYALDKKGMASNLVAQVAGRSAALFTSGSSIKTPDRLLELSEQDVA